MIVDNLGAMALERKFVMDSAQGRCSFMRHRRTNLYFGPALRETISDDINMRCCPPKRDTEKQAFWNHPVKGYLDHSKEGGGQVRVKSGMFMRGLEPDNTATDGDGDRFSPVVGF
jgi:hypothetical protein